MRPSDFDYPLPEGLIAQSPLAARDASRLLRAYRHSTRLEHRRFAELPELLAPGDLLVLNDTRTIPARLYGKKVATGGAVELLLVRPWAGATDAALAAPPEGQQWLCLGQASKGLKPGTRVALGEGARAEVLEALGNGEYRVALHGTEGSLAAWVAAHGQLPLPPYITRAVAPEDLERYQTVFARAPGSVAAPTAGLHFTPGVLEALERRGVQRAFITLEVGPGTFLPVREDDLDAHPMHAERAFIPEATAAAIATARREGRRVVAVGTTVVRTLEAFAVPGRTVRAGAGETALFIRPGYDFAVVDALLTNFHLPRSTLLMLVSAFLGRDEALAAYAAAVEQRYRFFSYGDAMLIEASR